MKEGLKSYYLTVFVDEKVCTSVGKSSHVARTSLLYLSLSCFLRLQYTIVSNNMEQKWRWLLFYTWSNSYKGYGIWCPICYTWLNEDMPRSQSRRELKETGSERVRSTGFFFSFFLRPWAFPISLIFFGHWNFFFLAACQQEVFSKVQRNSSCVGQKYILIGRETID